MENGVKVVYIDELPENPEHMIYYKKVSKDYLDRAEKILVEAEEDLMKLAKEKRMPIVEIYVLEKEHGEIPTESQWGKKGYVCLLFSLKNSD